MSDKALPIRRNLDTIQGQRISLCEKEISQINELAEILCDEAGEEEIFFSDPSFISRYEELLASKDIECADFNFSRVKAKESFLNIGSRAYLCMRICQILGITGLRSVGTFFDGAKSSDMGSICYVKNPYADKAYLNFASGLEKAVAKYCGDFSLACEDVYYGRSTYCIIPISENTSGRLMGFRNLALKYDLKIAAVTNVEWQSELRSCALMKKELELPKVEKDTFFEFRIKNGDDICEIITAAKYCGMDVSEIRFSSDGQNDADVVIKISDSGICGFLSYLCLQKHCFVPVGIYKTVKNN